MAKQSNKLTAKTVKNLEFDENKSNKYSDGGGLYLFTHKNGSKYWRMDYRRPITQKRNTLALGMYPQITLEQARIKRDEVKKMLVDGIDPAEERNQSKQQNKANAENTFKKFAEEWLRLRELENKVDSENIRRLNKDILPFIGNMPVNSLTVELLEDQVTNRIVGRGALESARRVRSIMGMILELPRKKRIISHNPAYDVTTPQPTKGNHNAIVHEAELSELLKKMWRYKIDFPQARIQSELALKLSVYIFQRPNEVRGLLWESVDFDNAQLNFVASKTHQKHIVPLSRQAYDILKQLEALRTTSKYVFPIAKGGADNSMSNSTIGEALKRIGYGGEHTAHGFRATAKTILKEEIEFKQDAVEHQLAHKVKDANGTAYDRTSFLRHRRQLMQLWADYLDTLRQGGDVSVFKPDNQNVIHFVKTG